MGRCKYEQNKMPFGSAEGLMQRSCLLLARLTHGSCPISQLAETVVTLALIRLLTAKPMDEASPEERRCGEVWGGDAVWCDDRGGVLCLECLNLLSSHFPLSLYAGTCLIIPSLPLWTVREGGRCGPPSASRCPPLLSGR